MMDLLVQVTTAYKISPAGNVLQPYGESGILPYKPSTPIGALDTWIVHIVPKNQALHNPSNKINLKQLIPPFEQTHRFQVNLPRHQLYVTRVSGRSCIREILHQACSEKNLDPSKYTLRHPKHLDKPLCEELSIAEYGHNQITMLSIRNLPTAVSTEDILLMNKYKAASDSGSGSGASSSVSPVPPAQPLKPVRKRRPAPKPPAPQQKQQSDTMVCHSRTSSDSSGYHEASVLSESPDSNTSSLPDSLPRRSKLPLADHRVENKLSRSLSNLHQASTSAAATSALKPAQSTSSLLQGRKKKPAPLPPVAIAEEKEEKSAPGRRLSAEGTPEGGHSPPHSEQDLSSGAMYSRKLNSPSRIVNRTVQVGAYPPSSSRGVESLSGSVTGLNWTPCESIPLGLVKRLSQQLFDASLIPSPPPFYKNSDGNVLNSIRKYENLKTDPFISKISQKESPKNKIMGLSPSKITERKKSCASLDGVPVLPSSVMAELEARLASSPPKINVKNLLHKFESGSSSDSATTEPMEENPQDSEYLANTSTNVIYFNRNHSPGQLSPTGMRNNCPSNTVLSSPDSNTSRYSCFRGTSFTPNLEYLSQQTSPEIMLPPPVISNSSSPAFSHDGDPQAPLDTSSIDEKVETYINMINESLTLNDFDDDFENETNRHIIPIHIAPPWNPEGQVSENHLTGKSINDDISVLYTDVNSLKKTKSTLENSEDYKSNPNGAETVGYSDNSDTLSASSSEGNTRLNISQFVSDTLTSKPQGSLNVVEISEECNEEAEKEDTHNVRSRWSDRIVDSNDLNRHETKETLARLPEPGSGKDELNNNETVLVAGGGRRKLPAAPVPRPRSTAFQTRPHTDVFLRLEGIFKKMAPDSPPPNPERESARLEAEIEEMFEQATREHVSLESGVELSRGPSPDWSWEYRLPAPPTFRDDVTTPSIAELQLMATAKSKQILFAPLESSEEVIKEESPTETRPALKGDAKDSPPICKDVVLARKTDRTGNGNIHITPTENKNIKHSSFSETVTDGHSDGSKPNGPVESISDGNTEVNKLNKIEKVYISQDTFTDVNIHKEIIAVTPELSRSLVRQHTAARNQRNSRGIDKTVQKHNEIKAEKVCININNEEPMDIVKNIGKVKIERSATVLRVIGRQERSQDQSAILNELTTVLTDRQTKPREAKPAGPPERPIVIPLTNFSITTYSGSKPVEIYKDKPVEINKEKPAVTELKKDPETQREINGIMRSNSSAEKKKIPTPVKRSASVVTTCQRRLDLSTLNGYLLEVEEFPLRNFRSNLRKTTSEYSINIDPAEEKDILPRPETGLQSLQVLRTILPQLSQSQGALHTLDQRPDKGEEKPAVCLTTWGERPKREVSIKTDRDYHVRSAEGVRVEVRAPLLAAERVVERRPRTSVYRSLETGNTKAIRLTGTDLGRLPIVTAVELKKQPDSEPKPEENGDVTGEKPLGGDKPLPSETPFRMEKPTDEEKSCGVDKPYLSENTFGLHKTDKPFPLYKTSRPESRQIRPPSYLFGCEPKVPPPPPPAPLVSPLVKLKPVSQRGETKKPPSADPRDQLLASIRNFGKSSLKKVSTR